MLINQNSLQYKQFKDFEKYAKFVCEKFDVSVQLESTRAETDGKTIYLPNILSMTSKELDMMYAILLHEAGHIRYSKFDASYFSQLKTQWHAFLANAIEDARIENLLIKDFGGAHEIFSSLYTDYTQDKTLMKKVFKHDGSNPDLFATMCFHIHNELSVFKTSQLKEISGVRTANRVMKFMEENKLNELLVSEYPKTPQKVIDLTNKIYDLFFSYFKKRDSSAVIDYKKEEKAKKELASMLEKIKQQAEKVEEKVSELKGELSEINEKIKNFDGANNQSVFDLKNKISSLKNEKNIIDSKVDWKNKFDAMQKTMNESPNEINKLEQELVKQEREKQDLIDRQSAGVNGRGKPLSQEQLDAIKEKIDVKNRQKERVSNRLLTKNQEKELASEGIRNAEKELAEGCFFDKNLDVPSALEKRNEIAAEIDRLNKHLQEIEGGKRELENKKTDLLNKIKQIQSDFADKAAEEMFVVDKMGSALDVDLDILPEMNYEDVWPEAASAQQDFDVKATKESGKMVRNGQKGAGLFGSNVRDIMTFIDKRQDKVEDIDVLEIFKGKLNISKLDDLNNDFKVMNYMEDRSVIGVFGTRREHIPFTTEFDSVKKDNFSKDVSQYKEIMIENASFYNDLKRVVSKNFKFSKKQFWKGAQEEGSLDARNLWKLPTRQGEDFYEVSNPRYENKVAVSILVDISGSQSKEATDYGKKLKSLVIGISQALSDVHVKHEVLGYHAPVCEEMRNMEASSIYTRRSNKLETVVFKEFNQKDIMGVLNMEPQMSDNSDGESLRIAMKRLKAVRAKSHILFVISDGKPFLSDTDISVLDEDFRAALRQSIRDKVQVYGIGFFDQLGLFFGERFCNASKNENILKFFSKINT